MKSGITLSISIILLFLALGGIGWLISMFNSLIQVRNNLFKAWENIDVLLIQRYDELHKLIEICRAYMKYEKEMLESLTDLRISYMKADNTAKKISIENEIGKRLTDLRAVFEGYPDLKANEIFQKAMQRVSDLEESIADRRVFFNDTVTIYNTQIEQVPQVFFAWLLRYKPHPLLKLTSGGKP